LALIIKKTGKGTIYQCSCCGREYNELPLTFGNEFPDYYYSVPPDEREKRVEGDKSLCVVDGEHFFHRGRMTIPINDNEQDLIFDVWTTLSESNFIKRNQLWDNPDRVNEEPYFGWLQTTIPTYGDTINIRTIAKENKAGLIPTIEVIEVDHPLKEAQESGISFEKALEIADIILNSGHRKTDN